MMDGQSQCASCRYFSGHTSWCVNRHNDERTRVGVGESLLIRAPWSEVNMWMRIAGKPMIVRLREDGMADVLTPEGKTFCAPITSGEAGLFRDAEGFYALRSDVMG